MKLEEYLVNFREKALDVEMDCPVGCAECCLNYVKGCTWEEGKKIRAFLESKDVDTSDFEDYEIEDKINIKCDYFQLACSINPAKPWICYGNFNKCDVTEDKKFLISEGHDYRNLELDNIISYLKQNNKKISDLDVKDMDKISIKIVDMTRKLAKHLRENKSTPLNKEGLINLFNKLNEQKQKKKR